ncbi:MAG: cyclic lactone autoinducer peptide [Lachnospiraceae bacterium]|nr:cyclic lactone autoinducer peptide [Lachnospiraceae bacterium]
MKLTNLFNKLKSLKFMNLMNALALTLAIDSANAACVWIMHQPKVPEEMKEYIKQYD